MSPAKGTRSDAAPLQRKPKTRAGKRALERRAPKLNENPKRLLGVRAMKASRVAVECVRDLLALRKPDAVWLTRRNELRPMDTDTEPSLEFLLQRNDCSLFMLASHQKKRPHNVMIGRAFDGRVLDALELGIQDYRSAQSFRGQGVAGAVLGTQPCMCFLGEAFQTSALHERIRNLLLDVFHGQAVSAVNLAGLDRVVVVAAVDTAQLHFRQYAIQFKKRPDGDTRLPRVQLQEIGPAIDFQVRRTRLAADEQMRRAMPDAKRPRRPATAPDRAATGPRPSKNIRFDAGRSARVGAVYVPRQDLSQLPLAKMNGLRRRSRQRNGGEG